MEWNEIITATVVGVDCNAVRYKNPNKKVPVVVTCDRGCDNIDITPTLDKTGNVIKGIGNGGAGGRGVGGVALTSARLASTTAGLAAQLLAVQLLLARESDLARETKNECKPNGRQSCDTQVIHYGQCKHQEDCIATRNEGSCGYIEATGQ